MSTLGFGNVHTFVGTLEFELERLRRAATRERALHALATEPVRAGRTDRSFGHHRRPRTPHWSGAR